MAGIAIPEGFTTSKQAEEALRASEARLRTLRGSHDLLQAVVESSADAIVARDREGRYMLVNASAGRLLRRARTDILGLTASALFPEEQAARIREGDAQVIARGETETTEEQMLVEQHRHVLLVTRGPLHDHDDQIVGVLEIARDVTEQRELEERLRRAQRMEAVSRLAGGIAHDYNNLMTVIHGSAEILLQDLPAAYARRPDLEEIKTAATRAAELTRQVLAFSRQQVLAPQRLDLNDLVGRMERQIRWQLGNRIDLDLALDKGLSAVRADPVQIEKAILNLVGNAREAMPGPRGGRLRISTADTEVTEAFAREHDPMRPGRYVTLIVIDTGVGMTEETRAHLFEPYYSTKPGLHGVGLGLATTYGIVKQSGGYIWVDSAPDAGTTVAIYLPSETSASPIAEPRREVSAAAPPQGQTGGGETVLVVDDEPTVRTVTKRMLERNGYTVLNAAGGSEALRILQKHPGPVHLLLTDVLMPEMNGREVAAQVRARRPDIRVMYMSAYNAEAIARDGLLDQGAGYLRKPFTISEMLDAVRAALAVSV